MDAGNYLAEGIDKHWAKEVMKYLMKKDGGWPQFWTETYLVLLRTMTQMENMEKFVKELKRVRRQRKQVIIMGNGGSSATASHFACDLEKTAIVSGQNRIRAISLTDNVPVSTAWANDSSFDDIFKERIHLANRGDLVVAISCSGKSQNVIRAIMEAGYFKFKTVGLMGLETPLEDFVDIPIVVHSKDPLIIEGITSVICHYITARLKQ
jgi:D-sedoheptulose 7-phosphate isomerase